MKELFAPCRLVCRVEDHVVISPLTVQEILDEQIARKLL